jgi:hypothetical protein
VINKPATTHPTRGQLDHGKCARSSRLPRLRITQQTPRQVKRQV